MKHSAQDRQQGTLRQCKYAVYWGERGHVSVTQSAAVQRHDRTDWITCVSSTC